jgi:ethanolamine utilization microcompartment shell protein EutS
MIKSFLKRISGSLRMSGKIGAVRTAGHQSIMLGAAV